MNPSEIASVVLSLYPDAKIIPMAGWCSRMSRASSSPFIPGITMSENTTGFRLRVQQFDGPFRRVRTDDRASALLQIVLRDYSHIRIVFHEQDPVRIRYLRSAYRGTSRWNGSRDCGSSKVKVVPAPSAVSNATTPSDCRAKP